MNFRNSAVMITRKAPIHSVIPTPLKMDGWEEDSVFVSPSDWVVNAQNFKQEGKLLAGMLCIIWAYWLIIYCWSILQKAVNVKTLQVIRTFVQTI